MRRRTISATLIAGLVCQTSFRKGGRLRRAPTRSRMELGACPGMRPITLRRAASHRILSRHSAIVIPDAREAALNTCCKLREKPTGGKHVDVQGTKARGSHA